ncbi:hypothetical protein Srubr_29120 [Streptomyces rubradiris]|uniref:Uncharacterized protein n=1 Tax=Streptomyces rubradiris TaxID=285531 RepID=A0ABQ3RB46_STRRR|nr:hypothetical protein GCM10018792_52000 [Streptomyces rubradiris]GHI53066.1 hypothetical protein Srubr_29120 [Streptomyces rubradiris]
MSAKAVDDQLIDELVGRAPGRGLRLRSRAPRTIVQTCVVRLLRNSFRYAARQDGKKTALSAFTFDGRLSAARQ